ncbi:MAG: DUF1254 domain-containing protein [Edaphobacter sp.]
MRYFHRISLILTIGILAMSLIACEPPKPVTTAPSSGASYTFERGYPSGDVQKANDDNAFSRAVQAYHFWYPTVSNEGIFQGFRDVGVRDNEAIGVANAGPRQVAFTANADTPYGVAVLDLSQGPWVIEMPPGPFIGLVDDHNQSWILDMGIPGPNAGKGGKHLIVGPGYKGPIPSGYQVGHSDTNKLLVAVRALPVGGDVAKANAALRFIKFHPLGQDTKSIKYVDTSQMKMDSTCLRWEDNFQFWQVLKKIVDEEPVDLKFPIMYSYLATLGIEKGKAFNPDDKMKSLLERAAKTARDQMLVSAFASNRPDKMAWPDRKWEWAGLVPNQAAFETAMGPDIEARDRWFIQAIVTSPAMFRRTEGAGSLYWLGVRDSSGAYLDGGKSYKLTVPLPVPDKLFWSVTLYDTVTRSMIQTDQDKSALRSLFELKDKTGSSVDLYFGPTAPPSHENEWIKTTPGKGWFAYFRIYGPEPPTFNGSWKPGDFEEVK